jgi:hypothetical protein
VSELEQRLVELGRELEWPETPAFVLELEPAARRAPLRPVAVALAVALAVAAGVLALSPGARSAFLELFRLQGAVVSRVESLPPVVTVEPDWGEPVSRGEAERRVGFELLDLGEPDAVYVRDGIATLLYGDPERPRLVLSQLRGGVYDGFVKKAAGAGTNVEQVRVGGERGLFVSGDEHYVMFRADGLIQDETTFLAGNVLLWNRGPLLLRLEADVARADAVELAESVE